jgi:hypothetical protein
VHECAYVPETFLYCLATLAPRPKTAFTAVVLLIPSTGLFGRRFFDWYMQDQVKMIRHHLVRHDVDYVVSLQLVKKTHETPLLLATKREEPWTPRCPVVSMHITV